MNLSVALATSSDLRWDYGNQIMQKMASNPKFWDGYFSYQLSVISYQLSVPTAKARGKKRLKSIFFYPLEREGLRPSFLVMVMQSKLEIYFKKY
ncbi:MAG: hypothetical protein F6K17_07780 [Okeania sp. SIO3C4]|nr:hypothetical protein [Okeania sp. SIO3C4]